MARVTDKDMGWGLLCPVVESSITAQIDAFARYRMITLTVADNDTHSSMISRPNLTDLG